MKKIKLYSSFLILLLLVITPLFYFFQKTYGEELEYFNVPYGNHVKQTLDIYPAIPNARQKLPVMIYVHGGSWTGGDKTNVSDKPSFFSKQGFVFVSVNYRLFPHATYNEMANDISTAVRWIYDHADDYDMDKSKIHLMGHSAGGHLVTLIGTNPQYLNRVGLSPQLVRSIVDLEGPIDLTRVIPGNNEFRRVFGNDRRVWSEASPMTYATGYKYPPILFVNHRDSSIYHFKNAAISSGNTVRIFECQALSHREITKKLGSSQATEESRNMTNAVSEFLRAYN